MHIKALLLPLSLFLFHSSFSQTDSTRKHRHFLRTNVTQFILRDLGFEYEYMHKTGVGITAGYSYKWGNSERVDNFNNIGTNQLHYLSAFAQTFSIGPTFMLKRKERFLFYTSALFFYRYMWYDHLIASGGDHPAAYKVDQSLRSYIYGGKWVIGFRWLFPISKGSAITLDLITGLSVRTKEQNVTEYGSVQDDQLVPFDQPIENQRIYTIPAPMAGFKVGIAF